MIVDLTNLVEARTALEFEFAADELDIDVEDFAVRSVVKFSGELVKHIAHIDVSATIESKVKNTCGRCLSKIEEDLEIEFNAAFVSPEHCSEQTEKELDLNELEISIIENEEIDLKALAREQIILALPSQFICSEKCKGLCQICGANKNLIDCNCIENEIDPRWAALKKLIE